MSENTVEDAPGLETPPVLLTDKAVEAVRNALKEENREGEGLRIAVVGGGCSGFQYSLQFETEEREGDVTWDLGDLKVYLDAMSAPYLQGATVDFVTGPGGTGFKFDNPNAVRRCSCGSSFEA